MQPGLAAGDAESHSRAEGKGGGDGSQLPLSFHAQALVPDSGAANDGVKGSGSLLRQTDLGLPVGLRAERELHAHAPQARCCYPHLATAIS